MSNEPNADKPTGTREGPGGLFWISTGGAGFIVTMIASALAGFVPVPQAGLLFGVPAGILAGAAGYSARQRHRGWIVLAIIVVALLAGWITMFAMDSYEAHRGPTPLF